MYMTKLEFQTVPHSTPDEITPDEQDAIDAWLAKNKPRQCAPGETAFPAGEKIDRAESLRRFRERGFKISARVRKFQAAARKRKNL